MRGNIPPKLFLHAPNVHHGGGKTLLTALLVAIPDNVNALVQVDRRMPLPANLSGNIIVKFVEPSMQHRLQAEWWLAQNAQLQDTVLCFGNLPPLFRLLGRSVVFVQNRYLIDNVKLDGFSVKTKLRLAAERFWLSRRMDNADEFVVQTPSMKRLLNALTRGRAPVHVFPFVDKYDGRKQRVRSLEKSNDFDFLYVASGEPHKNHRQLIEAWCLLAQESMFPTLKLTVNRAHFPELCSWIEQKNMQYQLNVENMGTLPHDQVERLYGRSAALIYPSTFESFGLPLIEARQAGLPVLAPEMDYVRDVLDPEQTFDPESPVSIARAVKRFLKIEEQPLPLQDAAGFIKSVLKSVE